MTWELQADGTSALHVDIRGKTLDEIMVVTEQLIDEAIEDALQSSEIALRDLGASDDVIEAGAREFLVTALARKRACLARIRSGLID